MYLYIGKMMKVNVEWENMSLISKIVKKLGWDCEMKCEESTFSDPNVKKKFSSFPHFCVRRHLIMRRFLNFNKKWILVIIFLKTLKICQKSWEGKKNPFEMSTVIQNARKSNNICWGFWPTIHSANLQDVQAKLGHFWKLYNGYDAFTFRCLCQPPRSLASNPVILRAAATW